MAETGNLIDFDVIEDSKENVQSLPSGRSAKSLARVLSPRALASPSNTQDINDAARQEFEKEIESIDESDDPLDVYDRYCKWTLNAYPSAQGTPQSQLLPMLERATKAFLSSSHYKNDPRYLRLWLNYIRFFSDAPRETFAYLSRHGIGQSLALFYEEFAAWLESNGRWSQAEEVYNMGIEHDARPVERLTRKFGEFEKRMQAQPEESTRPDSPALPKVRPALAAKAVPFASTESQAQDPQAQQSQRQPATGGSRSKKIQIFSDDGSEARPVSGGSKGWDNIGLLAERKKENMVSAKPWVGETMQSASKVPSTAPKMMVFKDPSMSRVPIAPVENHPSLDQKVVNPRSGKLECVAVNLEAVYPDPQNPNVEFCFEELRAAKRGWLQRDWRRTASPKPESPVNQRSPLKESPRKQMNTRAEDFDVAPMQSHAPRTIRLNDENDENDENAPLRTASPVKSLPQKKKKVKDDDNKTRKIKVRELKNETQTIQTNLDSPQGRKIRRKKSSEPTATVTMCTKAARNEMYDIFNQPLDGNDTTEVVEDGITSDDDYTSAGESTGTGHISTTTSEFDEEHTDADLIDVASAPDTEDTGNNTGWTDFDTKKDVPKQDDDADDESDEADHTATEEPPLPPNNAPDYVNEEVVTPTSPEPPVEFAEVKRTFVIPLPPDGVEAPTRPYRDPDQVAQSRLPFMTPIAEATESSLGTATVHREKDYFSAKTPCPKGGQKTPVIHEDDGEPFSSPFQEALDEALNNQHPIPRPKLDRSPLQPRSPPNVSLSKPVAAKSNKDVASKGPIIKDKQCNPMDQYIRHAILNEMHPPLNSFKGYFDRRHDISNRRGDIRKYCKSGAGSKASKGQSDRASTVSLPPVLDFEGAEKALAVKRELGAGAFAPVYLAEPVDEDSEQSEDIAGSRRRLEAVKMEDPPTPWEFYIIRAAKRRLGVSRAADSIIDAYEMHLFQDEGFLIEEYRDQGTLLDLVNVCVREQAAVGASAAMDESLAMFFAVELLRTVEGLHSKGIIHGDLKPDNIMIRFDDPANESSSAELSARYDKAGTGGWSSKGISLIDFGRGIDMRAFQPNVQFIADWETSPTDCAEMRELRPWTFQADYHGLAAIIHVMLFGRYIDTIADKGGALGAGATKTYKIRESLKRYWQTEIWADVFNLLLNSGRAAESEEGGKLPALRSMRTVRERMEQWLESNGDKGIGLRNLVRKAEGLVSAKRRM